MVKNNTDYRLINSGNIVDNSFVSFSYYNNSKSADLKIGELIDACNVQQTLPLTLYAIGIEKICPVDLKKSAQMSWCKPNESDISFLFSHGYLVKVQISCEFFKQEYYTLSDRGWNCYSNREFAHYLSSLKYIHNLHDMDRIIGLRKTLIVPNFLRYSVVKISKECVLQTLFIHEFFKRYARNYIALQDKMHEMIFGSMISKQALYACSAISEKFRSIEYANDILSKLCAQEKFVIIVATKSSIPIIQSALRNPRKEHIIYAVIAENYAMRTGDCAPVGVPFSTS